MSQVLDDGFERLDVLLRTHLYSWIAGFRFLDHRLSLLATNSPFLDHLLYLSLILPHLHPLDRRSLRLLICLNLRGTSRSGQMLWLLHSLWE